MRHVLRRSTRPLRLRTGIATRRWASSATTEHDVVVVGGGPGGYVAAIKAAQLGLKTACVEKRGALGGTCLNVGCIPSKALLHSSHMYEEAHTSFAKHGIKVEGEITVDLPGMMQQKSKAVRGLTQGIEGLFKKNKVTYAKGHGKLTSTNEVTVTAEDGSTSVLKAKNIVIATGSDVMDVPGIERDETSIISSTGALSLDRIPSTMLVVGGGVIGLELGSVWRRLGSEVTVIEFTDNIAAGADLEVARDFKKILTRQGMKFLMGQKVTSASKASDGSVRVTAEPRDGGEATEMHFDAVLVSVGRKPYTDNLGLAEVGVKVDERGRVEVDDHLRTSVPNIWAIGDVVRGAMLAHKAEEEGIMVAEQLAGGPGHINYDAIPSVIYTHPEVAWVGLTQEQAKAKGLEVKVGKFPFMANSRARTNDDADGLVKFISDAKTDRILGVHIVNTNAGEMIAEPTMAIEYGASSEDLARTCHAHPTLMEAVKEAAMATYDKPIHF